MRKTIIVLVFLTACGGGGPWLESEKEVFMKNCDPRGDDSVYCECVLEAAQKEESDPADLTEGELKEITQDCRNDLRQSA